MGELPLRRDPRPNDLLNKQRVLNNQYSYSTGLIVIAYLSNMFNRVSID